MENLKRLEDELMRLSVKEREYLALRVLESLGDNPIQDEDIKIALQREKEIFSGAVKPISHSEFIKKTKPR